jgi:D-serine deaminase-like pyridoxal phosphate-dependent protein
VFIENEDRRNKVNLENLSTPCVLIDLGIVEQNIERMAQIAKKAGVDLRPHTKTHKIPYLASRQIEKGAAGITVAKVSEAEVMAAHGIKDIFVAYPVIGQQKIKRITELNTRIRLIIGVDSLEGAMALAQAAVVAKQTIEVRLEVDTGFKRTGVQYDKALGLAKEISGMAGLNLTGIYTFHHLIYQGERTHDRAKAGLEEGTLMVTLAEEMNRAGLKIKDISVGSTPTAEYVANVPGITEIRPGTYIFNDMIQVHNKSCTLADCAAKVLTTVVSAPSNKLAVIDGGNKTFSTDCQPNNPPYFMKGYGLIEGIEDYALTRLTEEHGMLSAINDDAVRLEPGRLLTVIPNHVCTTINLHNKVYFVSGETVEEAVVEGRGMVY